jgi:enterochelin esterase-like enzyme
LFPTPFPGAKPTTVEHIKIHGAALEGNLEGEAVDRDVIVFLPPSYNTDKHRRYPVVYALHGYSIGAEQWSHEIHVPQTIEGAFAQGAKEMIVVLPDSKTIYNGSMYSSSVTTGDFENYIARMMWLRTLMRTTAPSPNAPAAAWRATRWGATELRASG